MAKSTYITIMDWMVDSLNLSGNELVIYAIIHGFSQDGQSDFHGSIEYLSKHSGACIRSVNTILDKLVKKQLLVKKETKSYYYSLPDGSQKIRKSQGGCHHYCIYYTSISRYKGTPEEILSTNVNINTNSPSAETAYGEEISDKVLENGIVQPSAETAYGVKSPNAEIAFGIKKPSAEIAFGVKVPSAEIALAPSVETAFAPSAETAFVPSAEIAYNNKTYTKTDKKIETTTTVKKTVWSIETINHVLAEVFGSSSLFTNDFINKLVLFLNNEQLDFVTGQEYIKWSYEKAKLKAKTDCIGYFVSTVTRTTFYSQFILSTEKKESTEKNELLHCPVCNHIVDKNQLACPHCNTDVSDFNNEGVIRIKKQIYKLGDSEKKNLQEELNQLAVSILSSDNLKKRIKSLPDDLLEQRTQEVYAKYGIR